MINEFQVAFHFLPAIFNDDISNLSDDEEVQLEEFLEELKGYTFGTLDTQDGTHCQITGLYSDCTTLTAEYIK